MSKLTIELVQDDPGTQPLMRVLVDDVLLECLSHVSLETDGSFLHCEITQLTAAQMPTSIKAKLQEQWRLLAQFAPYIQTKEE